MTSNEPSSDDHEPQAIPHDPSESDTAPQPDSPSSFTTTRLEVDALWAMVLSRSAPERAQENDADLHPTDDERDRLGHDP